MSERQFPYRVLHCVIGGRKAWTLLLLLVVVGANASLVSGGAAACVITTVFTNHNLRHMASCHLYGVHGWRRRGGGRRSARRRAGGEADSRHRASRQKGGHNAGGAAFPLEEPRVLLDIEVIPVLISIIEDDQMLLCQLIKFFDLAWVPCAPVVPLHPKARAARAVTVLAARLARGLQPADAHADPLVAAWPANKMHAKSALAA